MSSTILESCWSTEFWIAMLAPAVASDALEGAGQQSEQSVTPEVYTLAAAAHCIARHQARVAQ